MKFLKKTWLITGIALPFVAGILVEAFTSIKVLGALWAAILWFGSLMTYPVNLPFWSLILISISGFAAVLVIQRIRSSLKAEPQFMSYIQDSLFGVTWNWDWSGENINEDLLIALCPQCSYQLSNRHQTVPRGAYDPHGIIMFCEHCGFKKSFDFSEFDIRERVMREIERKIRTNEYQTA